MRFTVLGTPRPQGSMRGFVNRSKKTGKQFVSLTSDNPKLKPWRKTVAESALMARQPQIDGPVSIEAAFYFQKPPSAKKARSAPTVRPDLDKLLRAILDAMTGICFADDAQVCEIRAVKHYGLPERAEISVWPCSERP